MKNPWNSGWIAPTDDEGHFGVIPPKIDEPWKNGWNRPTFEISSRTQQRSYVYKSIFLADARKFTMQFEMDSVTRPVASTEVL